MLENLTPQPPDKILQLMQAFREDPRENKIDLGVGVYRNAEGVTPVMRAVKEAERRIWESQETKAYTGLAGDPAYGETLSKLVLGPARDDSRLAAAATPGGTGAIRQAFELIRSLSPDATVWLSAPTWPNHPSILRHLGMKMAEYRYFDAAARDVDFAGMTEDLSRVKTGDVVLLHGCCHNPTGANLTADQWKEIIALMTERGAVPMIDIAYQGFGDGLEEDALGTRLVCENMPEVLIAASCRRRAAGKSRWHRGCSITSTGRTTPSHPITARASSAPSWVMNPCAATGRRSLRGCAKGCWRSAGNWRTSCASAPIPIGSIFWPATGACSACLVPRRNRWQKCVKATASTWWATAA